MGIYEKGFARGPPLGGPSPSNDIKRTFGSNKVQSLVDVGDLVESHLAAVRLRQGLAGDDFQQKHELQAIAEVLVDVLDAGAGFPEVAVAPCREGLEGDRGNVKSIETIMVMKYTAQEIFMNN